MSDREQIGLRYMLDAAQKAVDFANGRSCADLEADELFMLAEVRLIEIVGEAATAVSEEIKQEHPKIMWRQITATRNRLIHGYFDVDLDIVWSIIQNDLPSRITALEEIVSKNK